MRSIADALQSIAVTLWVGGLWVVGFIVAPQLFSRLDDRVLAGALAGGFFTVVAWIGIVCAVYLLAFRITRFRGACLRQVFFWITLTMLVLALAGEFGVHALMEGLRAQALPKEVMASVFRDRFMTWHGVASVLYVIQGLLGLVLVILHGRGK